jgi:hypothetical protein
VLWFSQLQFYSDGRRQLQPLVRLRTDNRRSDPSWDRSDRSTHRTHPLHRGRDASWDDARIHREAAPPVAYETFLRKETSRDMNSPDGCLTQLGAAQMGFSTNVVAVGLDAQPNGVRLSCGA